MLISDKVYIFVGCIVVKLIETCFPKISNTNNDQT